MDQCTYVKATMNGKPTQVVSIKPTTDGAKCNATGVTEVIFTEAVLFFQRPQLANELTSTQLKLCEKKDRSSSDGKLSSLRKFAVRV
jgi:hypothetical protein